MVGRGGPGDCPVVARRQGGVFTAAQARAEGWTARQVRRRVDAGRWAGLAGDGLVVAGADPTPFQYAVAASLTWPGCVVSHRTAAVLHGFPVEHPREVDVLTTRGRRSRRSIRVHVLPLGEEEVVIRSGLRVTAPVRTLVDCLAVVPFDDALDLWAWASTRRLLDHAGLRAMPAVRRRWHGTPQLSRLVALTADGAVSAGEHRLHRLLGDARIGGWRAGVPVSDAEGVIAVVDVLFAAARVIVEVDGFRAHGGRANFVADGSGPGGGGRFRQPM